ncbi:MAG: hypothetical protein H6725_08765 [Sandaracinaceae bacterium]|nr:hypothetical protein [Sandaracinaceae bacterium]
MAQVAPPAPAVVPVAPAAPAQRVPQRTMLGLPAEMLPPAQAPAPAPVQTPKKPAPARTMLGLPAVMPLPDHGAPAPAAAAPAAAPVAASPKKAMPARTMLGMPAAAVAEAARVAQAAEAGADDGTRDSSPLTARTRRKSRNDMGLTMVGDSAPSAAPTVADEQRPGRARASANYGMLAIPVPESSDDLPALPKSKAPVIIAAVFAVLLVVGGLVALGVALLGGGPEVSAVVAQTDAGEVLQLEVAEAEAGSRVRLAGREVPIEAGRATLPLASDTLHLGPNELSVVLVAPDGSTEELPLTLLVAYRIQADLSALEQRPPVLRYRVEAQPGSTVLLDGRPVTLDASGRGQHDYPVVASAEDQGVERIVRYDVSTPGGATESGRITTRVPYAALGLDRPGDELITDQASVEVAGSADPSATVTLDGRALTLREGRFLERVPLTEVREHRFLLMARQAGFAPRQREIVVRRVADLAAEAARYPVDQSLTYARIAQNPVIYRGQSIALEGRVYHVDVHEGRSVLQMMVRDCGGGQRCALWVTYPAATDATAGTWVRVIGEVAGEQDFQPRSGGATMTVPRVDARFVLPVR